MTTTKKPLPRKPPVAPKPWKRFEDQVMKKGSER
jgi:hypothetical protein